MFTRIIEIFIFSFLLYAFINIPAVIFIGILDVAWLALLRAYPLKNNGIFHKNLLAGFVTTAVAFLMAHFVKSYHEIVFPVNWSDLLAASGGFLEPNWLPSLLFGGFAVESICIAWKLRKADRLSTSANTSNQALYPEHKDDLQRLHDLMKYTRILGVDSTWGNGKSFVVDYFCKEAETQEKYYIIKIEALAYKYDEFDQILIDKLDELLRDNGIFSFYSTEIKPALESSKWGKFLYHFFRWPGANRTSALVGLQQELHKLPKSVLIVFEDLERVRDVEAVKRIFAIVERLADEKIQVIYEYDRKQLDASLSLDRTFIEKYIPMEMHLTDVSYETLAKYLWQELQMDTVNKKITGKTTLSVDDVKQLVIRFYRIAFMPILHFDGQIELLSQHIILTARRMKSYLLAIKTYLSGIKDSKIDALEVRTVVGFFFIQKFMDKSYAKMQSKKSIEQMFLFQNDGQNFTYSALCELIREKTHIVTPDDRRIREAEKSLNKILLKSYNIEPQMIFMLLDFDFSDYAWDVFKRQPAMSLSETKRAIEKQEEKRERIDHIVWNLLQNGTSELSNKEACAEKFIQDVLTQPVVKQHEALVSFSKELYKGSFHKDNTTVHLLGYPILENMAEAMSLHRKTSAEDWQSFVHLLSVEWHDKVIGTHFIQTCNYIKIVDLPTYLQILQLFNDFKTEGNLNANPEYMYFLKKYLSYIVRYGYYRGSYLESLLHSHEIWRTNLADQKTKDLIGDTLQISIKGIEKAKLLDTPEYREDIETIKQFLKKNLDLIQATEPYKQPSPVDISVKIEVLRYPHQKVIDDICAKFQNHEYSAELEQEITELIGNAYEERRLYPYEIRTIKSKLDKWKTAKVTQQMEEKS